jgi:hypothetical protein
LERLKELAHQPPRQSTPSSFVQPIMNDAVLAYPGLSTPQYHLSFAGLVTDWGGEQNALFRSIPYLLFAAFSSAKKV